MARYIDKDLLLKDIEESVVFTVRSGFISPELKGANKVVDRIMSAPTADVAEVKHGEWIVVGRTKSRSAILKCSNCGRIRKGHGKSAFCPDCGAKMDGGKAE